MRVVRKSLINRSNVRQYILAQIKVLRPGLKFNRVSKGALVEIEGKLRRSIDSAIKQHPSVGKTFKEVVL